MHVKHLPYQTQSLPWPTLNVLSTLSLQSGKVTSLPPPSITRVSYCISPAQGKIKIQNSRYRFYRMPITFAPLWSRTILSRAMVSQRPAVVLLPCRTLTSFAFNIANTQYDFPDRPIYTLILKYFWVKFLILLVPSLISLNAFWHLFIIYMRLMFLIFCKLYIGGFGRCPTDIPKWTQLPEPIKDILSEMLLVGCLNLGRYFLVRRSESQVTLGLYFCWFSVFLVAASLLRFRILHRFDFFFFWSRSGPLVCP